MRRVGLSFYLIVYLVHILLLILTYQSKHSKSSSVLNMRGKPVTSAERKIMKNVFSYFKANNAADTEGSLIQKTAKATRYPFATVRRVLEEASQGKFGHFIPMPGMKCSNRKEALSKIDDFH